MIFVYTIGFKGGIAVKKNLVFSAKSDFRVTIPGYLLSFAEKMLNFSQIARKIHKSYFFKKFPGIGTQKSIDFWVTIPGN